MNNNIDDIFNKEIILQNQDPLPTIEKKWQLNINICDGLYLGSRISPYYLIQQVIPNHKWITRYLNSHPLVSEHTDVICYSDGWNGKTPDFCKCFTEARRKGITNDCGMSFSINGQFKTKDEIFRFIYNLFYLTMGDYLPWIMTLTRSDKEKIVMTATDALDIEKTLNISTKFKHLSDSMTHRHDEMTLEHDFEFIRDSCHQPTRLKTSRLGSEKPSW